MEDTTVLVGCYLGKGVEDTTVLMGYYLGKGVEDTTVLGKREGERKR